MTPLVHWLLPDWIAGVPTHPPQHQSQRNPLHPLNSPSHATTSKMQCDPNPSIAKTRARRGNATCLAQGTQDTPADQGGSDSEAERPPVSSSLNSYSTNLLLFSDHHFSPAHSASANPSITQGTPIPPQPSDHLASPVSHQLLTSTFIAKLCIPAHNGPYHLLLPNRYLHHIICCAAFHPLCSDPSTIRISWYSPCLILHAVV